MKAFKLGYTNTWPLITGLFLISVIAFWQSYYILFFESSFYIHYHAFSSILWFSLLLVQPYLIRKRKLRMHRFMGKISYPSAAMVVISIVLLAHHKLTTAPESFYPRQTYFLYLQLSLAVIFSVTYGLAVWFRKSKPVHARLMIATVLTFVDPVLARFLGMITPGLSVPSQWVTFGIINVILIALSIIDWKNRRAWWVYPCLLLIYLLVEIPIYFDLTSLGWWQTFAAWFAAF